MKNKKNIILAVVICVVLFAAGIGIGLGIPSIKKSIDKKEVTEENVLDYIDIGDYKSLDVSIGVTKEDIEMEIDDLREQNTIYEQLEGTVADGDMVYADITGYVDGKGHLWVVTDLISGCLVIMKDSERSPLLRPQDNSGHPRTHDRPSLLQTT